MREIPSSLDGEPVEPRWNARDPYGSFRRYAEFLHQKARRVFLQDKTHTEMIFMFRPKCEAVLMQVPSERRDEFVAELRRVIRNSDIIGVVHIAEAWTRMGDENDTITRHILLGEMGISDLLPEHRGEALLVMIQSRNGESRMCVDPIVRDQAGAVSLGEGFEIEEPGGKLGRLFP